MFHLLGPVFDEFAYRADTENKRVESNQKMQLLSQALKRYKTLDVMGDLADEDDGASDLSVSVYDALLTLYRSQGSRKTSSRIFGNRFLERYKSPSSPPEISPTPFSRRSRRIPPKPSSTSKSKILPEPELTPRDRIDGTRTLRSKSTRRTRSRSRSTTRSPATALPYRLECCGCD